MTIGQALLAELDPSGRAPAASQAFNSLGNSLGPSVVAMALPYFQNYDAIAWLAAVVLSCALAIYINAIAGPRTDLR
jgi:predicted MFS family arabinose efflux permease